MAAGIVLEKIKRESKPIQARVRFWHAKLAQQFYHKLLRLHIHSMAVSAAAGTAIGSAVVAVCL